MALAAHSLVAFDIDGTLLATDRFWLEVGRHAVSTVYSRHGVSEALPPSPRFLEAIGLPMSQFWQYILPPGRHALVGEIEAEAQDLEEAAFQDGLGAMYPGARELLSQIAESGRAVALASNCGARYLTAFMSAFDLHAIVQEARCVDSPGISSKADMLLEIRACTGGTPGVMVGDRANDREAAKVAGFDFVLFTGGFQATASEPDDIVVESYAELSALLLPEVSSSD